MDFFNFKINNEDNFLCLCCLALILYLFYFILFNKKLLEGATNKGDNETNKDDNETNKKKVRDQIKSFKKPNDLEKPEDKKENKSITPANEESCDEKYANLVDDNERLKDDNARCEAGRNKFLKMYRHKGELLSECRNKNKDQEENSAPTKVLSAPQPHRDAARDKFNRWEQEYAHKCHLTYTEDCDSDNIEEALKVENKKCEEYYSDDSLGHGYHICSDSMFGGCSASTDSPPPQCHEKN